MLDRAGTKDWALTVLIVWTLALGGLLGVLAALPAAQGGQCDQVGGVITGTWTITTPQTCSGIVYTIDGSININPGGSLTLIDGGLVFAKDGSHTTYALNVNPGGALVLDHSFVSVQTTQISPYLFLNLNVVSASGQAASFTMRNGAYLKFPGWFNATGVSGTNTVLNITDSKITGFTDAELDGLGLDSDANNDAPVMRFSFTTASVYRSRIERLWEYTGLSGQPVTIQSSSSLYAYDTYIGVDYSNEASKHNELQVGSGSNAYLYNVTIDMSQAPSATVDWQPAFRPLSGDSSVHFFRWLHATVTDANNAPVGGASIWSQVSAMAPPNTATYPDNGGSTIPSDRTLWYLGRSRTGANQWNVTDGRGQATIPLWTDQITTASLPNANSFGDYAETASYPGVSPATGGVYFSPYPNLTVANNNKALALSFGTAVPGVICPSGVTTWSFDRALTGTVSVSGSLEITGRVTIENGGLYIDQQADACAYLRIKGTGALNLVGSTVWSNYPLVVDVIDNGILDASRGTVLALTQRGTPGLLRSTASSAVRLTDTQVWGNMSLYGATATLIGDTFAGPAVRLGAADLTRVYDAVWNGVTSIALLTDRGAGNLAFDIRNTTFDDVLTPQLVFSGTQYVQLTDVQLYDPSGTWYESMIRENAVVERYWWLTVNAVDGTGTLLADAGVNVTLSRLDPATLQPVLVSPFPTVGSDIYFTSSSEWPALTESGRILYRAFQESRTAGFTRRVDNTYIANGTAFLQGTTYYADQDGQVAVTSNAEVDLVFSSLTPDFKVTLLQVSGGNGNALSQPINTDVTLIATVQNSGHIDVRNVVVEFFSVDVDANRDGVLDSPTSALEAAAFINKTTIPLVPREGTVLASVGWHPLGSFETSIPVSVVVDPPLVSPTDGGAVRETNEGNNIYVQSPPLNLFTWPDLSVGSADVAILADVVLNNDVPIQVVIRNVGTAAAADAFVQLYEGGSPASLPVRFSVALGGSATATLVWRPASTGPHSVQVVVTTKNDTIRNRDYYLPNNVATLSLIVLTQPDLALFDSDYTTKTVNQNQAFQITVRVHNLGQTAATNTSVAVYLNGDLSVEYGRADDISVLGQSEINVTVNVRGIPTPGNGQRLTLVVDPDRRLNEGGLPQEANNYANYTIDVLPPLGTIVIGSPQNGTVFLPTDTMLVQGRVWDQSNNPIAGLAISIQVLRDGNPVSGLNATTATDTSGSFRASIPLGNAPDGSYVVQVSSPQGTITAQTATFAIRRNVPFLDQPVPILGIPYWLLLTIIAAVAAILVGITVYFKVYGLGKMVECGECGAFIPEDATTCPKCGVEFEKDMAKCSNCQAWIPVDVKQCPECGVEFATGQVEMADYQEKMRLQYDEVVAKFKEEAQRQLGRSLSDKEFQEWWRKQPTFVTFEDWLREEEEMRKMGSKPCPVCGTLNSVTATVCHKCGSLMKSETWPPSGGGGGALPAAPRAAGPPAPAARPPEQPPGGGQAPWGPTEGPEAVPRRVVRRPVSPPQPVVQKRIVKRPLSEGQQGEGTEGESQSSGSNPEDEL